jgi:hypothetical protein
MKIKEVTVRYSINDKLTKQFTIGDIYGKKNLKVPHAQYKDKRKGKQ